MAVVAGIDEAGYGPLLGPLAVTATAFRVPDEAAEADLWELFRAAVARGAVRDNRRLRVADSKKLHHGSAGIELLERNVLPFLAALETYGGRLTTEDAEGTESGTSGIRIQKSEIIRSLHPPCRGTFRKMLKHSSAPWARRRRKR